MRTIDYRLLLSVSFSPEEMSMMRDIYLTNDRLMSWETMYPDATDQLDIQCMADDVFFSHRIEGMPADRESVLGMITGDSEPEGIDEIKAAGLVDAYRKVHELAGYATLSPEDIVSLHRVLMIRHDPNGGQYRTTDSPHTGYGTASIIRKPVTSRESRYALNNLCKAYNTAMGLPGINPILLAICASLALFTISPFANGNGRMYRLALSLFLERAGIRIHRFSSLEKRIFTDLDAHLSSLEKSSDGWSGDFFGYSHFIENMVTNLCGCASELERSFPHPKSGKVSKADRIRHAVMSMDRVFTISDLKLYVPDISMVTVQQMLSSMVSEGIVRKIGNTKGARYAVYRIDGSANAPSGDQRNVKIGELSSCFRC